MKRSARVEVTKGRGGQPWRFRVRAANGEVVLRASEGYSTKANALRSARKLALELSLPVEDLTC